MGEYNVNRIAKEREKCGINKHREITKDLMSLWIEGSAFWKRVRRRLCEFKFCMVSSSIHERVRQKWMITTLCLFIHLLCIILNFGKLFLHGAQKALSFLSYNIGSHWHTVPSLCPTPFLYATLLIALYLSSHHFSITTIAYRWVSPRFWFQPYL